MCGPVIQQTRADAEHVDAATLVIFSCLPPDLSNTSLVTRSLALRFCKQHTLSNLSIWGIPSLARSRKSTGSPRQAVISGQQQQHSGHMSLPGDHERPGSFLELRSSVANLRGKNGEAKTPTAMEKFPDFVDLVDPSWNNTQKDQASTSDITPRPSNETPLPAVATGSGAPQTASRKAKAASEPVQTSIASEIIARDFGMSPLQTAIPPFTGPGSPVSHNDILARSEFELRESACGPPYDRFEAASGEQTPKPISQALTAHPLPPRQVSEVDEAVKSHAVTLESLGAQIRHLSQTVDTMMPKIARLEASCKATNETIQSYHNLIMDAINRPQFGVDREVEEKARWAYVHVMSAELAAKKGDLEAREMEKLRDWILANDTGTPAKHTSASPFVGRSRAQSRAAEQGELLGVVSEEGGEEAGEEIDANASVTVERQVPPEMQH